MYEVEIKVPADHEPVRGRLEALDAEPLGTVEQVDTYYDPPHRDFAASDEALRIRRERGPDEGRAIAALTYKGPLVEAESKTREEHETGLTDPGAAAAALEALGFEPAATVEKTRDRFRIEGTRVTLDAVSGVGTFVEVEREVAEARDVEAAREAAGDLLRELELDPDEQIRTSYLGLLLAAED